MARDATCPLIGRPSSAAAAPWSRNEPPWAAWSPAATEIVSGRAAAEGVEVPGGALPAPGQALVERGAGDVLDALHQLDETLPVAGPARREPHPAVAHDDGGDPVPRRGEELFVPRGQAVVVGVDVDEARHDERTVGVDDACATVGGGVDLADLDDASTRDRDVGRAGRCAGSVDDRATADDEVVGRQELSLAPVRGRRR